MRNVYKLEQLILRAIFQIQIQKYNKRRHLSISANYTSVQTKNKIKTENKNKP